MYLLLAITSDEVRISFVKLLNNFFHKNHFMEKGFVNLQEVISLETQSEDLLQD